MLEELGAVFGIIFMIFAFLFPLAIFGFAIFSIIFWILMLIDVVKRDFEKEDEKTMWVLIIALTHVVGALIYYFVVKKKAPAQVKEKKPSGDKK